MTHDMHSDNDVIQGIAESFWEVTEGTAKDCLDLAEIAYNAARTAGMVTPDEVIAPHEVMAAAEYLNAALDRIEELEDGIRRHRQTARLPRECSFTYLYDETLWELLDDEGTPPSEMSE